ncbi:MAG: DNA repair protein RecO [bacterium]|nr:DNA repair protein RecO [bacterium]MDZ4285541.1 DNA repair protein RecO [Candidatus Sungbacteria bacterium]
MTYTTQGIVLKKIPAGEADAIAVLYTRDFGKIRAFVQGVKKESAKLKGHIEPFSLSSVQFVIGNTGERLTYAQMLQSWPVIREDFDRLSAASRMVELVDQHCITNESDNNIWELLLVNFVLLNKGGQVREIIKDFERDLLECLGYAGTTDVSILGPGMAIRG